MDLIFFIKKNFMMIFLIIANVYIIYKNRCNSLEKMSNTNEIEEKINKIYQADIQSIRNLSEVASTLQKEGLTIPGNLKVNGTFNYLPKGTIVAFTGIFAPDGWALCNGQNGTPDLRGRFIYGYGGSSLSKTLNGTGGSETHKLTEVEMPSHTHTINNAGNHNHRYNRQNTNTFRYCVGGDGSCRNKNFLSYPGGNTANTSNSTGIHTHTMNSTGGNGAHNNMPPYHVLSYIMKL